jgi:hypothetical protein
LPAVLFQIYDGRGASFVTRSGDIDAFPVAAIAPFESLQNLPHETHQPVFFRAQPPLPGTLDERRLSSFTSAGHHRSMLLTGFG